MSGQDKRCGTCKHFALPLDGVGICQWKPVAFPESMGCMFDNTIHESHGADCPCWEAKEQ